MDQNPVQKRQGMRQELWNIMHHGKGHAGQAFNFVMVLLILLSVGILSVKFLPSSYNTSFEFVINIMEVVIISVFTVEYFLRIYAAPHRLRYIFSFFGLIDLLSIMPFYAGVFGSEYIRIVRLVRFLKIGEMQAGSGSDTEDMMKKTVGLVSGEHVEYVVTKHPLFLFIHCIPPAFALAFAMSIFLVSDGNMIGISIGIVLILFALIFLLKSWLDFNYDAIYVTNFRLIFHNQHLFGRSINQVNYFSITNVKPSYSSVMSFVFRYGSLDIETAADIPGEIRIDMVRSHEKAAHLIMQKCFEAQARMSTDTQPVTEQGD